MSAKCEIGYDIKSQMTKQNNKLSFDGPTIIYCPTKKATMAVAAVVKGKERFFYNLIIEFLFEKKLKYS